MLAGVAVHQLGKKVLPTPEGPVSRTCNPWGYSTAAFPFPRHRAGCDRGRSAWRTGRQPHCYLVAAAGDRRALPARVRFPSAYGRAAFPSSGDVKEYRAAARFNHQPVAPQLVEIFTHRVARQPEVKADLLCGEGVRAWLNPPASRPGSASPAPAVLPQYVSSHYRVVQCR